MKKIIILLTFMLTTSVFYSINIENLDLKDKICKITHNVKDDEGNTIVTYTYTVVIPASDSCKDMSNSLKPFSNWLASHGYIDM